MKKIAQLIFLIYLYPSILVGQINLIIDYEQILVNDTVINDIVSTKGVLYIDSEKKASVYHWDRQNKNAKIEFQKNEDGSVKYYTKGNWKGLDSIGKVVYKDNYKNFIKIRDIRDIWYIVEDTITLNWTIYDDTKRLNDMLLQKAECDFRGRHYTAWFNPDLPISDGPWKFFGLPGLIIEVYDEKKHVQFNFISLKTSAQLDDNIVKVPSAGEPIGITEFREKIRKSDKDMPKKIEADIKQQGLTVYNLTVRFNRIER